MAFMVTASSSTGIVSSRSRPGKRPFASAYPEATPATPAITVAGIATRSVSRNGPETTPQ